MPIGQDNLYLPEKYKVILGNGNVGLCTIWSDPNIVIRQVPQILDACAIIGTLYSKEGVNIILRNLCLNPQINNLLLWGKGNLSKTPQGKSGWDLLVNLWENGVDDVGLVNEINFRLHENMDFSIIRKVVENVKLIDVSDMELPQVLDFISKLEIKQPYMNPVNFPLYQRETDSALPSEEVGWVVHGTKIVDAWIRAIDRIVRYGTVKKTEYGNEMKELAVLTWVSEDEDIENPFIPDWPGELRHVIGIESKDTIHEYIKRVFFESKLPEGTVYTYGQRLRAYPTESGKQVDQIRFLINKIRECEVSRRAVAALWYPLEDQTEKSPACLTQIQILQNEGKIHLFATVRSHDMFKAGLLNAFGLRALQSEIANELKMKLGKLSITSNSAHIYEEDWENAKKLVKCHIWEQPVPLVFNEKADADPRGNAVVSIISNKLSVDLVSPTGEILMALEGSSAKELCLKIAKLDLLSRADHYMDIARQLQRAEIAMKLGLEFRQDKKLDFDKINK
ncbi:MAG: hypothetical protein J4428_00585 [Candidatus Aenigmarchaeota archaeon]|nr:hypothetical protein [Candidatus Aenigmarchaeota archaeon]